MDPYISFLAEHWMLSAAFAGILVLMILNEWRHRSFGVPAVSLQQLVDLLNHSSAVVIDIRSQKNFAEGHILGAFNIVQEDVAKRLSMLSKYKNKPVVVVCANGIDSPKIGRLLTTNGFTQLYYLSGGMDAWKSQNMPIVNR